MKDEGQIYKTKASIFLIFAWGLSYDLSKFSDGFTPFFRPWKTITQSLDKNKIKKSVATIKQIHTFTSNILF